MNPKIVYPLLGMLVVCNLVLIYMVNEATRQARGAEWQARQAVTAANNVGNRLSPRFERLVRKQLEIETAIRRLRLSGNQGEDTRSKLYSMSYNEVLLEDIALATGADLAKTRQTVKTRWRAQFGREQPARGEWVREPR